MNIPPDPDGDSLLEPPKSQVNKEMMLLTERGNASFHHNEEISLDQFFTNR